MNKRLQHSVLRAMVEICTEYFRVKRSNFLWRFFKKIKPWKSVTFLWQWHVSIFGEIYHCWNQLHLSMWIWEWQNIKGNTHTNIILTGPKQPSRRWNLRSCLVQDEVQNWLKFSLCSRLIFEFPNSLIGGADFYWAIKWS